MRIRYSGLQTLGPEDIRMARDTLLVILTRAAVMDGDDVIPGAYWIIIIIRQDIRNPSKKIHPCQ